MPHRSGSWGFANKRHIPRQQLKQDNANTIQVTLSTRIGSLTHFWRQIRSHQRKHRRSSRPAFRVSLPDTTKLQLGTPIWSGDNIVRPDISMSNPRLMKYIQPLKNSLSSCKRNRHRKGSKSLNTFREQRTFGHLRNQIALVLLLNDFVQKFKCRMTHLKARQRFCQSIDETYLGVKWLLDFSDTNIPARQSIPCRIHSEHRPIIDLSIYFVSNCKGFAYHCGSSPSDKSSPLRGKNMNKKVTRVKTPKKTFIAPVLKIAVCWAIEPFS